MSLEAIRAQSPGRQLPATVCPVFPGASVRLANRRTMALVFESDGDAIGAVLPEPLTRLPANRVIHAWSMRPGMAGLADRFDMRLLIPCRLGGLPCHYVAAGRNDAAGPPSMDEPAKLAELALRRRLAPRPPARMESAVSRMQCALHMVADADGALAVAQLRGMCPADVVVRRWWSAAGALPAHPGLDGFGLDLPLRRLVGAHYFITDTTLQAGRVLVDYLRPDRSIHAQAA